MAILPLWYRCIALQVQPIALRLYRCVALLIPLYRLSDTARRLISQPSSPPECRSLCAICAAECGGFRLAAAGVFVAAQRQKFLEELHLVSIKRSGFDFLAVVLRPLCSVANYVRQRMQLSDSQKLSRSLSNIILLHLR